MIFSSAQFFVFFAAVLAIYLAAKTTRQRAAVLLAASILFYLSWKPAYILLLGASLFVNHLFYNALLRKRSLPVLVTGIVMNLLALAVFKYLHLALDTIHWIGHNVGWMESARAPVWVTWALPLGISFYTFHMLSALIDVYRGDWAKPVGFPKWCLYVTFFPHLIAGPILRPGQLIDQLGDLKPIRLTEVRLGAAIFIAGLVKKILIADNLGIIVDKLYASPGSLGFGEAWFATLAFAFQIYCDFSGYSEMAIGLARVFGVRLPRNFIFPYISASPSEFWKRWHITLSQWLRDYLYIPLGGSRGTSGRTYFNLMVTMLLGGLWHGSNWTFAFWGLLHGLYLVGERLLRTGYKWMDFARGPVAERMLRTFSIPFTFLLINFTWVFFRAAKFRDAWAISGAMLGLVHPASRAPEIRMYEVAMVAASVVLIWMEPTLVKILENRKIDPWWKLPFLVRGLAYASLVIILLVFGGETQKFIYFDF